LSLKIAIYPQVIPHIIKDDSRIESAHAHNISLDHLLTALSIFTIALYSSYYPHETFQFSIIFLFSIQILSVYFYIRLFFFDREKKNKLMDLGILGAQK
jgi:hypothetical protein